MMRNFIEVVLYVRFWTAAYLHIKIINPVWVLENKNGSYGKDDDCISFHNQML